MSMTDGNPNTVHIAPESVSAIIQGIQRTNAEAAKTQDKKSRFQEKVKSLLGSEKVDKDNLGELQDLIEAKAQDLKEEFTNTLPANPVQNMLSRYQEAVQDALEPYIDGDEQLEKCDKLLAGNVLELLGKNVDVMTKFNAGQLDRRQIKNAVKEVVEAFSKDVLKRDIQAKGVNLGNTAPGTVANADVENNVATDSIYDIPAQHQRTAAVKFKSFLMRTTKMSDGDAGKKAYAMAMSLDGAKQRAREGRRSYT